MTDELFTDLTHALAEYGFQRVTNTAALPSGALVLKRQTWNTNRAIVAICLEQTPADLSNYLRQLRKQVAFRCGFFPFFWGIGIQVVVVAPGLSQSGIDPTKHIACVDNQWAIIQSIFFADSASRTYQSGRTWGQFVTGKFQDAVSEVLSRHFQPNSTNQDAALSKKPL